MGCTENSTGKWQMASGDEASLSFFPDEICHLSFELSQAI
jgi:hypothetical protein